ncbi:Glycosyltransferase involved in cell wall bisynthesis [Marivirga sericea]|uniref:Glycosyltransferase involved in cell wall bisynthesis n=1 Tax=Marivirga sericea TaxID=1028 RepID=A0A1X7KLJ7_9BACT|nr:glycosyltransferase [Marivirga sericea]SMG42306.1 Glycosyltransferase involved in cell wall bisynthesis [Marivirga sericea]
MDLLLGIGQSIMICEGLHIKKDEYFSKNSVQQKRILIVDNSTEITGAYNSILTFSNALKEEVSFHFAISSKKHFDELNSKGFTPHLVDFLEIQKSWKVMFYLPVLLWNSYKILKIVRKHHIDLIHVNDLYNLTGVILKIFKFQIPVVYHVRLLPNSYIRKIFKLLSKLVMRYSDKVICVSKTVFKALPESSKKIIIHDAVLVTRNQLQSNKDNTFSFLFPANFIRGKGQNYALKAFYEEFKKSEKVKLLFAGGNMGLEANRLYKAELQKFVKENNRSHQIEFLDFVSNMPEMYCKSDVSLVFSDSESFSMVTLESMVHGTPVIATKCGGPEEIITHNYNSILVNKADIEQMRFQMRNLYENKDVLNELGGRSKLITEQFKIENTIGKLSQLYSSIC